MTNTNRAKEKAPAVQAGQSHAAPIRNAGGMGEEMGHFGCTGYSLDTPARTAAITALVQAMQASVYARSSICGLIGWGGEFGRLLAAQGAIEFFQRPQARIGDVPVDELGKPRMANPR